MIIGIDPGKNGAIVTLTDDGVIYKKQIMPTIGKLLDINALKAILSVQYNFLHVFIEDVHAIYGSAAGATFQFGFVCGAIQGVVNALGLRHTLVQPKKWQKEIYQGIPEIRTPSFVIKQGKFAGQTRKGSLETKKMSLLAAKRLFPNEDLRKSDRCKIPHDGIVDALLIAEYGRRIKNGNA